jgi:hypothetical protein
MSKTDQEIKTILSKELSVNEGLSEDKITINRNSRIEVWFDLDVEHISIIKIHHVAQELGTLDDIIVKPIRLPDRENLRIQIYLYP